MTQIGWKEPYSFVMPESRAVGISWSTWSDYNENGIDDEYTNEPHCYEIIDGYNSSIMEFTGSGLRFSESYLEDYNGYETGPNSFDVLVKAMTKYYDWSDQKWIEVIGYHSYTLKITDSPPNAVPGATLDMVGHVTETAQAGDPVLVRYGTGAPFEFSEGRFSDGAGPGTVRLSDSAGGRFRLDHEDGRYVLKVASASLVDYDQGDSFKLALEISDGTTTVTNYVDVGIDNAAPTNLRNVGGNATVAEHAAVGSTVGFTAFASDPKGGKITYNFDDYDRYFGLAINPETGAVTVVDSKALNYESAYDTGGQIKINVIARDSSYADVRGEFTLNIQDTNDAPVFPYGSNEFTRSADDGSFVRIRPVSENTTAVGQIVALDEDRQPQPDTLTYSLTGADADKFTISNDGTISFKAAPNYEAPTDADKDNVYRFNINANDGTVTTTEKVSVAVANVNEVPVVAGGATKALTVAGGTSPSTVIYAVAASDPDANTTLNYTIESVDGIFFDLDQSGNLSFRYSPDVNNPSDWNKDNVYDLNIVVSDGQMEVLQNVLVTVSGAASNTAPVIEGNANILVNSPEGAPYAAIINASDRDGDPLTFSISGGPDADLFRLESAGGTARLIFKSPSDFETSRDVGGDNIYNVIVRAADSKGGVADQAIAVQVTDISETPVTPLPPSGGGGGGNPTPPTTPTIPTTPTTPVVPATGGTASPAAGQTQMVSGITSGALVVDGAGKVELTGTNTYAGPTEVKAGTLVVNGSIVSPVSVGSGATLGGSGSTGTVSVAAGGTLAPGNSPGILSTKDLSLAAGAVLKQEIGGTASGQFDQLKVTGTVSLSGASLDVAAFGTFASTRGDRFVIIDNDGTDEVIGSFAGLSEGAVLSFGARSLRISYQGGDGNDVSLTDTAGLTFQREAFGTVVTSADSGAGQVYALYEALLNRAPDPLGLEGYVTALENGASLTQVAGAILGSPEHGPAQTNAAAYVERLYTNLLNRSADAAGLQDWTGALAAGASQASVAAQIATSAEAKAVLAPAFTQGVFVFDTSEASVARLYYGLLDRAPDAGGLRGYAAFIETGGGGPAGEAARLGEVVSSILTSQEYTNQHTGQSDAAFVFELYQDALGRAPDAGGEAGYLSALAHGTSRAQVALDITQSPEAQVHWLGHINDGTILSA